jgi:hypothetical protein
MIFNDIKPEDDGIFDYFANQKKRDPHEWLKQDKINGLNIEQRE